jgi:hypothetical protein
VLPAGRLPVDFESRKTVSAGPYIAHHQAKMELAHSPGGLGCGSEGELTKQGAAKVIASHFTTTVFFFILYVRFK